MVQLQVNSNSNSRKEASPPAPLALIQPPILNPGAPLNKEDSLRTVPDGADGATIRTGWDLVPRSPTLVKATATATDILPGEDSTPSVVPEAILTGAAEGATTAEVAMAIEDLAVALSPKTQGPLNSQHSSRT